MAKNADKARRKRHQTPPVHIEKSVIARKGLLGWVGALGLEYKWMVGVYA